ncbi:MAG: polyamine aminopropyltransferase [Clostridia bacterium]|nr:polyamine aminopropyltransferase [Clostridia bacterium]
MELWYTEEHTKDAKFSIRVKQHIFSHKSQFQQLDVFDTFEFGRMFTLDGLIMLTEKDEFIYHEMITHVAMGTNTKIKNVLVIGGGDGGTVRELTRYKTIERIDMVEIDRMVVETCKKYLKFTSSELDDDRVTLYFEDGVKFVENKKEIYDLIIVDSTDPIGPGEGLFTRQFYKDCFNALSQEGILINQNESPYYQDDAKQMIRATCKISDIFPLMMNYQVHIPTYPSGHWIFGFASKGLNPVKHFNAAEWESFNLQTKYYNTDIHTACFALPNYVREMIETSVGE